MYAAAEGERRPPILQVQPLVVQGYKSAACFATCWLALLATPLKFTWWGTVGAGIWVRSRLQQEIDCCVHHGQFKSKGGAPAMGYLCRPAASSLASRSAHYVEMVCTR